MGDTVISGKSGVSHHGAAGGHSTAAAHRHELPHLPGREPGTFEQLLREDARNEATTEFLPLNPNSGPGLRDVLVHGLIGAPDKRNFPSCCALVKQ